MTDNSPPRHPTSPDLSPEEQAQNSGQTPLNQQSGLTPDVLAQMARSRLPYPGGIGVLQQVQLWQGQYPPPEAIERYEKVLPGVFAQMVQMAQQLQNAQIDGNERAQNYLYRDTKRGHYLGFMVSITALLSAVGLALTGHAGVAVVCLSVPVMAVAKAFIDSAHKSFVETHSAK